ncbi:MAG: DUF1232 domain-containing protein [Tissierellia bacterium]|nr:DUF1232 domain-containing protein [Tissierellia bacterium]
MRINVENIILDFARKAKALLGDKERLNDILNKAKELIKNNKELNEIVEEIKVFVDLVRDYVNGVYKDISTTSIVLVVIGLLYLVTPIDLIPDFAIGGFIDDAAVIAYILKKIQTELEAYKEWKEANVSGMNNEKEDSNEQYAYDFDNDGDNLIEISLGDDDVEEI